RPAADELAGHDRRVDVLQHDFARDEYPGRVRVAGYLVHHGEQYLFHDRAQSAGAGAAQVGLVGDGFQRIRLELQLHAVQLEQALVLLDQRVARLGEDAYQRVAVEAAHVRDYRQPADELGDQPELEHVLGHDLGEDVVERTVVDRPQVGAEAEAALADPGLDDPVEPGERAAADEQHVGRVDLDELLVRVLAAALRRYVGHRTF